MRTQTSTSTKHSQPKSHSVLVGLGFAAVTLGVGALGTLAMRGKGRPGGQWFRLLRKPWFQPPNTVFAPVWSALYAMIAYSGYRIWKTSPSVERTKALGLWTAQLILNGMWTPMFFGARRPRLALADIVTLDATATSYWLAAGKIDPAAARWVVPYLGWLGFATALNATIVAKN